MLYVTTTQWNDGDEGRVDQEFVGIRQTRQDDPLKNRVCPE